MVEYYQFSFKTSTAAQAARATLSSAGIPATLRRTNQDQASQGCGYLLQIQWMYGTRAMKTLQGKRIPYEKIFYVNSNGNRREASG